MEKIIVVGLGNIGREYSNTRHNLGFIIVDFIQDYFNFPKYKNDFDSDYTTKIIDDVQYILCKPKTFVNRSGIAVQKISNFFNVDIKQIFVIHDELDLKIHEMRKKKGGGSAGHNGIKSIVTHLSSKEFYRLRIGIDHPRNLDNPKLPVDKHVLGKITNDEMKQIEIHAKYIVDNYKSILQNDE